MMYYFRTRKILFTLKLKRFTSVPFKFNPEGAMQGGSATVIWKNRTFEGFLEQHNVNVIGRYIDYLHFRVFDSLFFLTF